MIKSINTAEFRRKRRFYTYKLVLFSFCFAFFSLQAFSQDSIPIAKDSTEEKELNFQQFFFKALSEKSIGNFQKAIENLESCHQILTNNVAVFFEFSKNYLLLQKTQLAKEYIDRALLQEPANIWMLKHLVEIHIQERRFSEAISIQQKVVAFNIKERENLVNLYFQNKNYKKAISLIQVIEQHNTLSAKLKKLKAHLEKRKEAPGIEVIKKEPVSLKEQFKNEKSYAVLKQILILSESNWEVLLQYADEGIALFPAQPFIYLMKGRTLNAQKKHEKALLTLQNGVDFVIDDQMEANFYNEMATAYKGLGRLKEAKTYLEKLEKIKNKE